MGRANPFYRNKERTLVTTLQDYMNVARASGMRDKVQASLETLLEKKVKEKTFDDCSVVALVRESTESLNESEQKLQDKLGE
ncbi:hypothetical protein [Helicobacter cynogastricus]|uniref:hypothetical protein n=1 Tax=Helicobacter cynogastricus TaxID=329937 RepID=UPI001F349D11|nr:hypothetical protein [Helicobacter cynogastricus]